MNSYSGKALEEILDEFRSSLGGDTPLQIESYLKSENTPKELFSDLLAIELQWRFRSGERPTLDDYLRRFPNEEQMIRDVFAQQLELESVTKDQEVPTYSTVAWKLDDFYSNDAAWQTAQTVAGYPHDRKFGDYEIIREIAKGGMGVVFEARHIKLDRVVALKMIRSGGTYHREIADRFMAEAQAVAKLDHPCIVPIYDVGEVDGQPFFSMAYVNGESLSERVQRIGPMPPHLAAKTTLDIAAAIQHAHDRGIIHRDLKPQNVLVQGDDRVLVTDFGIAKFQESDTSLTKTGQILGTPAYMPPEQATGNLAEVGSHSDVYSLGATLYFLLTARPPFQAANSHEILRQVIEVEPIAPRRLDPSIPKDLETICLKSLSKQPEKRYESAASLAADLRRWLAGEPIVARRSSSFERGWKWCRRRPVYAGLLATAVIALLLASFALLERGKRLGIESDMLAQRTNLSKDAQDSLQRVREYLVADDYATAQSERQRLAGLISKIDDQPKLSEQFEALAQQIDAISDFETARVRRCGMPSCQFDYASFSPISILSRLSLNIESEPADALAEKIQASAIKEEIIAALDDWAWVLSESHADGYAKLLPKIIEICNHIDTEASRVRIRESLLATQPADSGQIVAPAPEELQELHPPAILFVANALAKREQLQPAIELLTNATLVHPNDFWLNLRLSELAHKAGSEYCELRLKHLEIARVLRPNNHVIVHNLAGEYSRNQQAEQALQILNSAIESDPNEPYLRHAFALLYHNHYKDYEKASQTYISTIQKFPDFAQSYINLSIIRVTEDDVEQAEKLIKQALEIQQRKCDEPYVDIAEYYNLGLIYVVMSNIATKRKDNAQSEKLIYRAIELFNQALPFDSTGLYGTQLSYALTRASQFAKAKGDRDRQIELLTQAGALQNAADRGETLMSLARLSLETGDLDAALAHIRAASEALPADDNGMAANILLNATIFYALKLDELFQVDPEDKSQLDNIEAEAIQFLQKARERKYFSNIPFGILLSTNENFRPLDRSSAFWPIVLDTFKQGISESPDEVGKPESPALYFAARAAIQLSNFEPATTTDPGSQSPADLRNQAHRWLSAKLTRLQQAINSKEVSAAYVKQAMTLWTQDESWNPVRASEELEKLDSSERSQWEAFWKEVEELKTS